MARVLMVVQHPVKDFDAWRIEYDNANRYVTNTGSQMPPSSGMPMIRTRLRGCTGSLRSMKLMPSPPIPI